MFLLTDSGGEAPRRRSLPVSQAQTQPLLSLRRPGQGWCLVDLFTDYYCCPRGPELLTSQVVPTQSTWGHNLTWYWFEAGGIYKALGSVRSSVWRRGRVGLVDALQCSVGGGAL
jgi:hypothetical protein